MINVEYVFKILPELAIAFAVAFLVFAVQAIVTLTENGTVVPELNDWQAWLLPIVTGGAQAGFRALIAALSTRGYFTSGSESH